MPSVPREVDQERSALLPLRAFHHETPDGEFGISTGDRAVLALYRQRLDNHY